MKPVCIPCERFMRPLKNGYYFLEGMPTHNRAKPGKEEPESWKPYKLWVGDLWHCPTCGYQTIIGVPPFPIAEHYEKDFEEMVKSHKAANSRHKDLSSLPFIKDC